MTNQYKINKRQATKLQKAISNPIALRQEAGENQGVFWGRLGSTQSAGSRYEGDRNIPTPTQILLGLRVMGWVSDEQLDALSSALNAE